MNGLSQQTQPLLSSSAPRSLDPPSINSDLPDTENSSASALKVYWKELTSGQYRLSTLLLYSLVASLGSLLMGITLGYSSVTQLSLVNTTTYYNIHSPTKTEFEWFGVSLTVRIKWLFQSVSVCVCVREKERERGDEYRVPHPQHAQPRSGKTGLAGA